MEQKPKLPFVVWVLALVACVGTVAQFLAAQNAFGMITENKAHGFMAALLIEAAVIVEALQLMRSRSVPAGLGLIVALLVSGTYNYVQAEAAQPDWGLWRLGTLAVGPLAALMGIGLVLGEELFKHDERVTEWQALLYEQVADEAARERQTRIKEERERDADRKFQRDLERARFEHELKEGARKVQHELKEVALATRREERRKARGERGSVVVERLAFTERKVSAQWAGRWATMQDFLSAVRDDPALMTGLSGAEFERRTGMPGSTSRRWVASAKTLISKNGKQHIIETVAVD